MKLVKEYFRSWDKIRVIRLVLGLILFATYYFYPMQILMAFAAILTVQAVFNLSCPGGSCSVPADKTSKTIIDTEKYNPKNN